MGVEVVYEYDGHFVSQNDLRLEMRRRLADNYSALMFHKQGISVDWLEAEEWADEAEGRAWAHTCGSAGGSCTQEAWRRSYVAEVTTQMQLEIDKHSPQPSADLAQTLDLGQFAGGLRPVHTTPPEFKPDAVWGWLLPGSRMLPYVLVKGTGVAIGRGKEMEWSSGSSGGAGGHAMDKRFEEVQQKKMGFIEVADGRISRLHCIIKLDWSAPGQPPVLLLEDCSSNGTFHNGRKMSRGEVARLSDGDRISLVLSVAPLLEQYFTFHAGDPRAAQQVEEGQECLEGTHSLYRPGDGTRAGVWLLAHMGSNLVRTSTSRYTTAEQSTLEDLKCQICLNTLAKCVAIEPCGHNFCATCLSHHFGSQLQSGLQLSCPFRCPPPERIIVNYAVRALVELLSNSHGGLKAPPRPVFSDHHSPAAGAAVAGNSDPGSTSYTSPSSGCVAVPGGGLHRAGSYGLGNGNGNGPLPPGVPLSSSVPTASTSGLATPLLPQLSGDPPRLRRRSSGVYTHSRLALMDSAISSGDGSGAVSSPVGSTGGGGGGGGFSGYSSYGGAGGHSGPGGPRPSARESIDAGDFYTTSMSLLCPLDDSQLPMDAVNMKAKQVEVALAQLKHPEESDPSVHQVSLEALARLAWSDDSVRETIAQQGGIRAIVEVMTQHAEHDGIQCNACLALMSLVRGEGDVCQSNQWQIAKASAVEAIAAAMRHFRSSAMVQLSALLCFIPLALENTMMQSHICQEALEDVVLALDMHQEEMDLQTKALVLLGVLIQGEDAVHDAIRQRELEASVPQRVARALATYGADNEDILWAGLFVLAVLVRDGSPVYASATHSVSRAGLLAVLQDIVSAYKKRYEDSSELPDEMIITAGDYLVRVLEPRRHPWTFVDWDIVCMIVLPVVFIGTMAFAAFAKRPARAS